MIRGYQVIAYLKIIALAVLITGLWASAVISDDTAPQINILKSVEEAKEPGVIKAQVFDDTKVSSVQLFYRKTGDDSFKSVNMELNDDVYYRELKKELGLGGTVEYYLVAQDTSGNESTLPDSDPQGNPLTASDVINVSEDEVVLGSPTAGEVYDTGDQLVMITFYKTGRQIDYGTIRLRIDEVDRTREADIIGNTLMWEPRRPLTDGEHKIEAVVNDVNGDPIGPNIWTFSVKSKMTLPLGAEGDFFMGIQHDDRSTEASNVPLWNNKIDLGMNGETGFLSWKAGAMLSSEETSFLTSEKLPDRQPINRFFIEARTRHLKLRFGDSNPTFSDLSLKGIRIRGLNVEFKSNRFNTNFIYGASKRELDETINIIGSGYQQIDTNTYVNIEDPTDTLSTSSNNLIAMQDPTTGQFNIYEFSQGTPKRDVIALKVDAAPMRNRWATWKVGFNFFGAEDDTTTVNYRYDPDNDTRSYTYRDSSFYTDYKPKKNWVGTIMTELMFNDNKSSISAEFGGTIVTENMFSFVTEDLKAELPDEIDDEVFRFNGSTQTSFDKLKLKDDIAAGLGDALTSVYSFKLKTAVPIPFTKTRLTAEAYKTPTHYVSLGNPQQKTDITGMKFDMKTRILRDQVSFNVGYNAYSDNLAGERKQYSDQQFNQMDLTKDTSIANVSVSLNPSMSVVKEYSPSVSLGYRTYTSINNLDLKILDSNMISVNDTTSMIDTATNTLMLSFGGTLPVGMQRHNGMLSISNMTINDNRPMAEYDLSESDNMTVMFNVNSVINPFPVSLAASVGHTANNAFRKEGNMTSGYSRREVTTGITLLNVAGTYKWFRDKRLKTTAGLGYIGSSNGESGIYNIDNNKISVKFQADYRITSISSIGAQLRFINYTDNANTINDYTEPIIGFNLKSTF
ncbi:hypothetical protein ACFL6P_01745 [Candidatus Latescibacterota bacterium]